MKIVRLSGNTVVEIIPEYALPVEKWYGSEFAAQCMEAPDEAEQGWRFDPGTGVFSPGAPEPPAEASYTADDLFTALLGSTLADESGGGGVILKTLAALGPEKYNALSRFFHAFGLCGEVGA